MRANMKMSVVYKIIAGLYLVFAVSCGNPKPAGEKPQKDTTVTYKRTIDTVKLVSNLDELHSYCPKYTFIETCDLSNLGLKEIPVLKLYSIRKLNLSHNELKEFDSYSSLFPKCMEELNISHCNIGNLRPKDINSEEDFYPDSKFIIPKEIYFHKKDFPNLKKVNISYNKIERFTAPDYTEVIDTNYNKCRYIKNEVRKVANPTANPQIKTVKLVKSLKELYELAPNTIIEVCDLSNQGLKEMPVLRPYNIKRLDISGNDFSQIPKDFSYDEIYTTFPESLVELDMSNCRYGENFHDPNDRDFFYHGIHLAFKKSKLPHLKIIDVSHNHIAQLLVNTPAVKMNASHNDLRQLIINTNTLKHLDVSYNWNMNDVIGIAPESLKTLKADSCAHGMKLRRTMLYKCKEGEGIPMK